MPCRSRRRSPMAESSSSTRPRPRRCPACARSFIARTSARSSARSWEQGFEGICEERRPPFEDDVIRYYGQYIALAVADTFETAKAAADAVRVTYDKEKPNVETELKADDDPDVVAHHVRLRRALAKRARRCRGRVRKRAGQARPNLCHAGRDAQSDRAARDDRDLGWLDVDAVRVVAGSRQPPERARADVRLAEGERPRHHQVRRLGFRQQAVAMDALSARRRRGAAAGQAGEARAQPQDDVPDGRSSAAHPAARAARRDAGRQTRLAPARLRLPHGQCSMPITKTAARRRRSNTACPTCA